MATAFTDSLLEGQLLLRSWDSAPLRSFVQVLLLGGVEHSGVVGISLQNCAAHTVTVPRFKCLRLDVHKGCSILVASCQESCRCRR